MPMLKSYIRGGCDECDTDSGSESDSKELKGGVFGIFPEKATSKFLQDMTAEFRRRIAEQKALEEKKRKEAEEKARPKTVPVASRIPASAKRVPSKATNQIGAILPASSTFQKPDQVPAQRRQILLGETLDSGTLQTEPLPPITESQAQALATVEPEQAVKTVDVPILEDPKKEEAVTDTVAEIQGLLNDMIAQLELPAEVAEELKEEVKTAGVPNVLCWDRGLSAKGAKENIAKHGGLDVAFIGGEMDGVKAEWNDAKKAWFHPSNKRKALKDCSKAYLDLHAKGEFASKECNEPQIPLNETLYAGKDRLAPFFCRVGTKKDIAPWLIKHFHPNANKRYVEPFMGGGAVYWFKKPSSEWEVINEFSNPLARGYELIRTTTGAKDLIPELTNYKKTDALKKALRDHYGNNYISKTKIQDYRLFEIDKIERIIVPWIKRNPPYKYGGLDAVPSSNEDRLKLLYYTLFHYCNGMAGNVIDWKAFEELVKGNIQKLQGRKKEGGAEYAHPFKKPSNPYTKIEKLDKYHARMAKTVVCQGDYGKTFLPYKGDINKIPRVDNAVKPSSQGADSEDTFYFLDPPYEKRGAYEASATDPNFQGFNFVQFVERLGNLKGKWFVTINGGSRITQLFRTKIPDTMCVYALKCWVKNKAGKKAKKGDAVEPPADEKEAEEATAEEDGEIEEGDIFAGSASWRYEIFYANYPFKDSVNLNDKEAFEKSEEWLLGYNGTQYPKSKLPKNHTLDPKETPDETSKKEPVFVYDKAEGVRKPPINWNGSTATAPATDTKAKKPRGKKATAPAPETATETVQEAVVPTAPKPKRGRKKKEGSGRVADMKVEDLLKLLKS